MVKSRDVDVENDRNYTEDARVLRMVKGLDPVQFCKLQLTLDQNEKMGLDIMPKTMLEALELINEFKVKAPSSMQQPGGKFKQCSQRQSSRKDLQKGSPTKGEAVSLVSLRKFLQKKRLLGGNASSATKRGIGLGSAPTPQP